MDSIDLLYLMKTPFFLGSMNKVIEEGEKLEISDDDAANNAAKTLLLIRTMAAKNDIGNLKEVMTSSLEKPQTQSTSQNSSRLMQYIFQGVSFMFLFLECKQRIHQLYLRSSCPGYQQR